MLLRIRTLLFLFGIVFILGIHAAWAQDKVQIEVWLNDDELGQCVKDVVTEGFNASSKTAQVKVVLQPNVNDTLKTSLAGGSGPDIIPVDSPAYGQELAKAGLLQPLDAYIKQYEWDKRFVPWALELGKLDGKLYVLPDSLETLVIWYNKTLFDKNGWKVPKTMDELYQLSKTISDAGIVPFGNAFGECLDCMGSLPGAFINHFAGPVKMYDALTGTLPWTDKVFVDAISKLNDMVQNGWFDGGKDRMFTDSFNTVHEMLGSGQAAMNLDGSWFNAGDFFGEKAGNTNDYDWFPIPTADGQEMYMTGVGAAWGINVNSKHTQEAAEYLDWAFSQQAQADRFNKCNFAFAPIQLDDSALSKADARTARIYQSYSKAAAAGNYGYANWAFFPAKMGDAFNADIQKVFLGKMTPEEYMKNMQDLYTQAVADKSLPPLPAR
jgi:raffinose/stachyose/melibiose transport system substrate-binding protein